jgi:hypothetical protein
MDKHLNYLKYVCKHKWFVFRAGLAVGGIPLWRLIIHDYSKFSKAEWTPYVNRFFGGRAGIEDKSQDPQEFHRAWLHHLHHNPHHWEHWITPAHMSDPLEMPEHFVREMIADWLGAGKGITGSWDLTEWYEKTESRHILHPATKEYVRVLMNDVILYILPRLDGKGK